MLDNINTPILCKQVPRIGNKFSQWLGTVVLKSMGWRYSGTFPCCSKMILAVAPHTSNWDFVYALGAAILQDVKIYFSIKDVWCKYPIIGRP